MSLDQIPLDRPITSAEGLDVNHASRARIQFLAAQSHAIVTQTQFADAKAAALLTLSAFLSLGGPTGVAALGPDVPFLIAANLLSLITIMGAILAILPRIPGGAARERIYQVDRFSWPGLVGIHASSPDYSEFMRGAEASVLVLSLARSNQAMARVLHRKFSILRVTFLAAILSLACLGLHHASVSA